MELDKYKKSSNNTKTFKELNLRKKHMLKHIQINSSIGNINYYKNKKIIPLSSLFKYKLNNISQNNIMEESKFNSVRKIPIDIHLREKTNSQRNYNSISLNKISFIKLPKIKNNKNDNNEKGSIINSILNKFDEYDNKFKEQEKISNLVIQKGDKYLNLKKDYIDENDKYNIVLLNIIIKSNILNYLKE